MASIAHNNLDVAAIIDSAVRQLVSVSHWSRAWFVSLPIFYPGGGAVTVKIEHDGRETFSVNDNGFAYREVESLGADRSFSKTANRVALEDGVRANRRLIFADATTVQLAVIISKVGVASWKVAHHICEKVAEHEESVIAQGLYDRLVAIFGAPRVKPEGISLIGLSTNKWDVSAFVALDDHGVVFDAVSKNRNSIYRTATKFHDLAALDNPPRLVAVVSNKEEMGVGLALLAQAGRVIEEDQSNDVFERAAA